MRRAREIRIKPVHTKEIAIKAKTSPLIINLSANDDWLFHIFASLRLEKKRGITALIHLGN